MQAERFDPESHRSAVDDRAARHRGECARAVGPACKETEDEHPEERRLKASKREHIDEPDERRRRYRQDKDDHTEHGSDPHGETAQPLLGNVPAVLLCVVEVDVLHHGGGRNDEYARDGRDGGGERPDDRKAEQLRRHDVRHELRNHAVDAPECLCIHAEHAAPKHADEVDGDIHKGNDHRPDDHGAVHITAAAVADAAHDGLRQGNGERPHEQPLRDIERDGHAPLRGRGQHRGMRRT